MMENIAADQANKEINSGEEPINSLTAFKKWCFRYDTGDSSAPYEHYR